MIVNSTLPAPTLSRMTRLSQRFSAQLDGCDWAISVVNGDTITNLGSTLGWFDIASLTKPVTADLVLSAIEDGVLHPEFNLGEIMPLRDGQGVRLWQLATHQAGLRAYDHRAFGPYGDAIQRVASPRARADWIASKAIDWHIDRAGSLTRYSDLGYALMAQVLEQARGRRLSEISRRSHGAGLFWPIDHTVRLLDDPMAVGLGGDVGHAGIVSTVGGVGEWLRCLLNQSRHAEIVRWQMRGLPWDDHQKYTFGFDRAIGPHSIAGRHRPVDTIGHLGFTGCSLWFSPVQRFGVVLLTNAMRSNGVLRHRNGRYLVSRRYNGIMRRWRQSIHTLGWALCA